MRYQNAAELLPAELLEALQGYLDGGYLYIPRRAEHRRAWGERTRRKEETLARNRAIFRDYTAGLGVDGTTAGQAERLRDGGEAARSLDGRIDTDADASSYPLPRATCTQIWRS